jgi:hypothetical protein
LNNFEIFQLEEMILRSYVLDIAQIGAVLIDFLLQLHVTHVFVRDTSGLNFAPQ